MYKKRPELHISHISILICDRYELKISIYSLWLTEGTGKILRFSLYLNRLLEEQHGDGPHPSSGFHAPGGRGGCWVTKLTIKC